MDKLESMKIFVRIVESGSFSSVARELNMLQPSVSKHMNSLEKKLNVRLLNRTTRKLSLTDSGKEYYERCRNIIDQVEEMDLEVSTLQNQLKGTLRVNAPFHFGREILAPLIFKFKKNFPNLKIDLSLKDRYVDLTEEGVDVAIRFGQLKDSQLVARHIGSFKRMCVASDEYLLKNGLPEKPEDLQDHNCITYTYSFNQSGNEWDFSTNETKKLIRVSGDFRANSGLTIKAAAIEGLGIGNLPAFSVKDEVENGTLTQILSSHGPAIMRISAVYTSTRLLPKKVKLFIDYLQKELLNIPMLRPKNPIKPIPRIRSKSN